MFKTTLKIAFRGIIRDKYYTIINVLGLSIGLASTLLIFSYIHRELSYDSFHPDVERLYRVDQTNIWDPQGGIMSSTGIPLAPKLAADYPEVEAALRINTPGAQVIRCESDSGTVQAFYEQGILAADSNFFSFFGVTLLEGDPARALEGKNKVVISAEISEKLFGGQSAIGRTLLVGDDMIPVQVTGVTASQPDNMHFQFDYLLSLYTNPRIEQFEWSWIWTQIVTYIKVRPGADAGALEQKLATLAGKYVGPMFARIGIDYKDFMNGQGWNFYLHPVKDIHLYSGQRGNRLGPVSDIRYVYIFSVVAVFVSLLAIINFINLSTARGANRAKEVGVKKTLGARRKSLVFQFQFESLLLVAVATLLGLCIAELLRIYITHVLEMELPFTFLKGGLFWFIPLLTVVVGMLAGIYPALYLTAFRPASVLKGKIAAGFKRSALRNLLVVVQFGISVFFIASTGVVFQQLKYFREKDLGFDKEHVLVIDYADKLGDHLQAFRDELAKEKGVLNASVVMDVPGRGYYEDIFFKEGDETKYPITQIKIDEHYFETMNFGLAAGRTFEEGRQTDANSVILNETTCRMFGWTPHEAIGKRIRYAGDEVNGPQEVIGVVKDFHFQALNTSIAPLLFFNIRSTMWGDQRLLVLKFSPASVSGILGRAGVLWKELAPDLPFRYSFLDEEWAQRYREEKRLGGLFALFTGLSIAIAMIGMVGLVTYSSEQRKKEIGVRKVFGASVAQVLFLLNANFTRLILVSFVLAAPVTWYAVQQWLEQFPYRIHIDPKIFIFSGLIIIAVTWLTVSYQSMKAAMTNPTDVLKEE